VALDQDGKAPHLVAALAHELGAVLGRGADYAMTVKANMPTLHQQLRKLPWSRIPLRHVRQQGPRGLHICGTSPRALHDTKHAAILAAGKAQVTQPHRATSQISVVVLDGHANIAAANRHHARDPQRTLKLLQAA
jgi:hypothetical protein